MQLHYCKYNMTISCKNPKRIFENWEISRTFRYLTVLKEFAVFKIKKLKDEFNLGNDCYYNIIYNSRTLKTI